MVEKWIKFSQDHRDTLLNGKFTPRHPELQYPVIEAESDKEVIIGLYDDGRIVDVPAKKTFVMNASGKDSFVIRRGGKISEVSCKSGDWIELCGDGIPLPPQGNDCVDKRRRPRRASRRRVCRRVPDGGARSA